MKIFLSGILSNPTRVTIKEEVPYILESYEIIKAREHIIKHLNKYQKMYLIDSGAFTFMGKKNISKTDLDNYVERYAKFLKDNKVKYYFELDVDSVVGLKAVEEYRAFLEKITGRKSIPVWHLSRGIEYWKKMCEEYPYIAIGGIAKKEFNIRKEIKKVNAMTKYAHKHGAKVHGLGFSRPLMLSKAFFDSIDSTTWLNASRFGSMVTLERGVLKNKAHITHQDSLSKQQRALKRWLYLVKKFDDGKEWEF